MKRPPLPRRLVPATVVVALLALVPTSAHAARDGSDQGRLRQVGTYAYLTAPDYDAVGTLGQVLGGSRTLGLGTFDDLDGELVILGGTAYRVGTDGTPQPVGRHARSPFAQAVEFAPDRSVPVPPGTPCAALDDRVAQLAGADGIVAVRVRGTFTSLVTRSVPAQAEPFPPLSEVVIGQTTFDLAGRRAALVGFRSGADVAGLSAPGLHLHGLTADRSAGGHVLSCAAGADVHLSVQRLAGVDLALVAAP